MGTLRVTDRPTATQDWVTASLFMNTMVTTGVPYERPRLSLLGQLYSRLLGPLPVGYQKISRRVAMAPIGIRRWHRWLAYGTAVTAASLAIALQATLPWTRLSLVSLGVPVEVPTKVNLTNTDVLTCWVLVLIGIVMLLASIWLRNSMRSLLLSIALFEEQYFRTGAETWPLYRRIVSCISLGVTAAFIPVFPIGMSLSYLIVSRAVFMTVYRRSYVRTDNNPYLATLDAARVHTLYDEATLYVLLSVLVISPLGTIFLYT